MFMDTPGSYRLFLIKDIKQGMLPELQNTCFRHFHGTCLLLCSKRTEITAVLCLETGGQLSFKEITSSEPQSCIQIINVKLQTFNKAEKHEALVGTMGHYEGMDAHLRQYCDCDKEWST